MAFGKRWRCWRQRARNGELADLGSARESKRRRRQWCVVARGLHFVSDVVSALLSPSFLGSSLAHTMPRACGARERLFERILRAHTRALSLPSRLDVVALCFCRSCCVLCMHVLTRDRSHGVVRTRSFAGRLNLRDRSDASLRDSSLSLVLVKRTHTFSSDRSDASLCMFASRGVGVASAAADAGDERRRRSD